MEATAKTIEPEFKPIELTILIDEPGEAEKLYAIFNHGTVTDGAGLKRTTHAAIRGALSPHIDYDEQGEAFNNLDAAIS